MQAECKFTCRCPEPTRCHQHQTHGTLIGWDQEACGEQSGVKYHLKHFDAKVQVADLELSKNLSPL